MYLNQSVFVLLLVVVHTHTHTRTHTRANVRGAHVGPHTITFSSPSLLFSPFSCSTLPPTPGMA